MARTVFSGPVLSGTQRFGPLRAMGYTALNQNAQVVLTNTTTGTATYGGISGRFVNSNTIPNLPATLYVPQAGAVAAAGPTVQAVPADTASNIYRGVVFYLPASSKIINVDIYCTVVPTVAVGTILGINAYVSNNYTAAAGTPTYAATGTISAVGKQALSTLTATQINNQQSTTSDVQVTPANREFVSQVVCTVAIVGDADMTTISAGGFVFNITYVQLDGNIGTLTTYPYGNMD